MPVYIKRVYDPPAPEDGWRVLVDRIWPRGLSKDEARIDEWRKELAPSTQLRQWFGHDPAKFAEFRSRYRAELQDNPVAQAQLAALRHRAAHDTVTLVFAARDEQHNNAVVFKELLESSTEDMG